MKTHTLRNKSGANPLLAFAPEFEAEHQMSLDALALASSPALVLYHAACMDGIASAACAHRALDGQAEFVAMAYGQPAPDVTDRTVFVLDFSFEAPVLQHMLNVAQSVTLLDHHESAWKSLKPHAFCCTEGKKLFHIEMGKCGARLTWEHFFPALPLPAVVRVVEAHDLWVAERSRYEDTLTYLERLPKTLEAWLPLLEATEEQLLDLGRRSRGMTEAIEALCRDLERQAHPLTLGGVQGLAVNAPHELRNEMGNLLAKRCGTFGLTWHVTSDRQVKVSLRGGDNFDVLPLGEPYGAKGHPRAAGLYLELSQLEALLGGSLFPRGPT